MADHGGFSNTPFSYDISLDILDDSINVSNFPPSYVDNERITNDPASENHSISANDTMPEFLPDFDNIMWNFPTGITGVNNIPGEIHHFPVETSASASNYGYFQPISQNNTVNLVHQQHRSAEAPGTSQYEYHGIIGRPISVWPPENVPFGCSFCTTVKELTHSDVTGTTTSKLEIHGKLGIFHHAVLQVRNNSPSPPEYQMFDFRDRTATDVKNFLIQFCDRQVRVGFLLVPDPMVSFYEALCVGISIPQSYNNPPYPSPANDGNQPNQTMRTRVGSRTRQTPVHGGEGEADVDTKSTLSAQRARTRNMNLDNLKPYYHLPIREASKRLLLCPTVVKNICRRNGMRRWPFRILNSYIKKIRELQPLSNSDSQEQRLQAESEIQKLNDRMDRIYNRQRG